MSGVFITLSGTYYIIGRFYYIIGWYRPLEVHTATAEERGVTPSTAGQDDGCGPNRASGSLQLKGTRQERIVISLRRQITTGIWNVQ